VDDGRAQVTLGAVVGGLDVVAQKRNENIWPDDSERLLAAAGEQKFRRAARGLLRLVPEVRVVLSSPFARTWRTAEILK